MRVMAVDGNNCLVRAERAAERSGMRSSDGVLTGALLIFVNSLAHHLREERPDAVVVCWDGGRSRFRLDLYPGYKKSRPQRDESREDPEGSFGMAKTFLSLANIPHVERQGYEADDLVAEYWRLTEESDDLVILSSDHDLLQLLGPGVTQVKVSSRPPDDRWTAERLLAERGYEPRHMPYVMALQGDDGDDVPGLHGIGPKKAAKMMAKHGWSWLGLLASDELDEEQKEVVQLALRLVDLRDAPPGDFVPLPPAAVLSPTSPGDLMFESLLAFLRRYELASVERRLVEGSLWPVGAGLPRK